MLTPGRISVLIAVMILPGSMVLPAIDVDLSDHQFDERFLEKKLPPDTIPAIREPVFLPLREAVEQDKVSFLERDDWLVEVESNGQKKLYCSDILVWHEIVNDSFGSQSVGISYCILTGSWVVFDSYVSGHRKTFGVSGFLYCSNLVMYDYQTGSTWLQLEPRGYSGPEADSAVRLVSFKLIRFEHALKTLLDIPILIGSARMPPLMKMYGRSLMGGLEDYDRNDAIRSPVPAESLNDGRYLIKALFFYFPEKNIAVYRDKVPESSLFSVAVDDSGKPQLIESSDGSPFVTIYWFALRALYPDAIIEG